MNAFLATLSQPPRSGSDPQTAALTGPVGFTGHTEHGAISVGGTAQPASTAPGQVAMAVDSDGRFIAAIHPPEGAALVSWRMDWTGTRTGTYTAHGWDGRPDIPPGLYDYTLTVTYTSGEEATQTGRFQRLSAPPLTLTGPQWRDAGGATVAVPGLVDGNETALTPAKFDGASYQWATVTVPAGLRTEHITVTGRNDNRGGSVSLQAGGAAITGNILPAFPSGETATRYFPVEVTGPATIRLDTAAASGVFHLIELGATGYPA